jgi:hypothetical protein
MEQWNMRLFLAQWTGRCDLPYNPLPPAGTGGGGISAICTSNTANTEGASILQIGDNSGLQNNKSAKKLQRWIPKNVLSLSHAKVQVKDEKKNTPNGKTIISDARKDGYDIGRYF